MEQSMPSDDKQVPHTGPASLEAKRHVKTDHANRVVGCVVAPRAKTAGCMHRQQLREQWDTEVTTHERLKEGSLPQSQLHSGPEPPLERKRERRLVYESATLFSNIPGPDPCPGRKRLGHDNFHKYKPTDLEKRFWMEGKKSRVKTGGASFWASDRSPTTFTAMARDLRGDFAMLPHDVIRRIAGSFSWPTLWAATCVCRSWSQALKPLREGMLFVYWGKLFKHGRGGVAANLDKALDSFIKGAIRGCAAAMVDTGLLLWELGRQDEGMNWYKQAAELGYPAGQCNLGLAYLQEPCDPVEAVKWLQQAATAGHVRAQYSLALCLQQGRGVDCNLPKAACWYLRAAEGGSARAMYNTALCYRNGEGIRCNYHEARRWMQCAAIVGHRKAQFEHGLTLFAEGDGGLALVFLELATRAGETGATHIRDALLMQLSPKLRADAISCADNWQGNKWQQL